MSNFKIQRALQDFCTSICRRIPIPVLHQPEARAKLNWCFSNVQRKVEECGGKRVFGWQFIQMRIDKTPGILIAGHHAIWRSPEGSLVDITPCLDMTLRSDKGVLFLSVEKATLLEPPGCAIGICRPGKVHALATTAKVKKFVEAFRLKQQQVWEEASGLLA